MRIFASRVLKLRLFGNLFGIGWGNAGSPCVRQGKRAIRHHILLPFVFVLVEDGADRTTESAAPPKPSSPTPRHGYQQISANALRRGFETYGERGAGGGGPSVHGVGFEAPLLDCVDSGTREYKRALQELRVFHAAIAGDHYLQDYSALLSADPGRFRIGRINLPRQQRARGGLGYIDRPDRGQCCVQRLGATGFRRCGGDLGLKTARNSRGGSRSRRTHLVMVLNDRRLSLTVGRRKVLVRRSSLWLRGWESRG